jgi:hypothetical protein
MRDSVGAAANLNIRRMPLDDEITISIFPARNTDF